MKVIEREIGEKIGRKRETEIKEILGELKNGCMGEKKGKKKKCVTGIKLRSNKVCEKERRGIV